MEHARLLLEIGLIVIAIKVILILCNKCKIAPVFGMVLLGIIIGPGVFGLIEANSTLKFLGDIGVLFLLFLAGLETDPTMMKKTGKVGFFCAVAGVFVPFILGIIFSKLFGYSTQTAFFTGCILTATSVSVTVMTLWDMGKLRSILGSSILNAAIIDDVIGIVVLVVVMSFFQSNTNIVLSILKLLGYIFGASIFGLYAIPFLFNQIRKIDIPYLPLSLSFSLMFCYSGIAEYCDIAPITGAYLAGLFISFIPHKDMILKDTEVLTQSLFTPLFFASLGLVANFHGMGQNLIYVIVFISVACIGKILGCGFMAKAVGMSKMDSLRIGIGMMPRGEVALVIATLGLSTQMITMREFNSTVLLVMFSAAMTPLLLKLTFRNVQEDENEKTV